MAIHHMTADAQAAMSRKLRALQQEEQNLGAACDEANHRCKALATELRETQAELAAQRHRAADEKCAADLLTGSCLQH